MKDFFNSRIEAKVPVLMQRDSLECGAVSLAMVLAYYGKWIPVSEVRTACGVSRDGTSGKNLLAAARSYGLVGKGKRVSAINPEEIPIPCILHYNNNHFVVFCGYKSHMAIINDPAKGRILIPKEEFERSFSGLLMICEPGDSFVKEGKKPNNRKFIFGLIHTYRKEMLFLLYAGLISSLIGLLAPPLKQIYVDNALSTNRVLLSKLTMIFMITMFLFEVIVSVTDLLTKYKINRRVSFESGESFFEKLLTLNMDFFTSHMTGDLVGRQKSNESISQGIVQQLAPILQQFVTLLMYVVILVYYNPFLALIGIVMSFLSLVTTLYASSKQMDIMKRQVQEQAKVRSYSVYGINAIETIKASGAERGFYNCWSQIQAGYHNQRVKISYQNAWITLFPQFMELLSTAMITVNAALLIMQGKFSIGALVAFQAFLAAFYSPVNDITEVVRQIQLMNGQIDRVEEVFQAPADPMETRNVSIDFSKLDGTLKVQDVTFGYGKLQPAVIHNISFEVKNGGSIGIAGGSGCGKSTLLNVLLGLYPRWEGDIAFGGVSIDKMSRNSFSDYVGIVRQEVTLFAGTVRDNLKMWDDSITDEDMIGAAKDALIHDVVMERNGGYDSPVLERGANFSGGQRQKMEIARALIRNPKILILDEATSALDSVTEQEILNNLNKRGITLVVVAHRLSAIRSCDEILVMKSGKIVQRGSHDVLIKEDGIYRKLVECEKNDRS